MKKQVLLANISESDQSELQALMDRMGLLLEIVDSAETACDMALEAEQNGDPYSLLLLDMEMPGQFPGNLSRQLRFSGYEQPIIGIVDQLGNVGDYAARDGGCNDVICRPLADRNTLCTLQRYVECTAG